MENYFITNNLVTIIMENLNEKFINCLKIDLDNKYYDDNNKNLIKNIITEIEQYLYIYNNDLLSYINNKNKTYYITLKNNLFNIFIKFIQDEKDKTFIINLLKFSDSIYIKDYILNYYI